MQTQLSAENEIGNGTPQKSNRIWFIVAGILLACCCLTVLAAGAVGAFYFMAAPVAAPAPAEPVVSESNTVTSSPSVPRLDALITASELEPLSPTVGIIGWTLSKETPGEYRVCRAFQGQSASATPNEGMNCIFSIVPGTSVNEIGDEFLASGQLFADEKPVASTLNIPYEHIIYVGSHPNGHTVIDLFVIKDDLMYWASVTIGTRAGVTPEANYQNNSNAINEFLYEVVKVNLSK